MSLTFTAEPTADANVFTVSVFMDGVFLSKHTCATRNGARDLEEMVADILSPTPPEA